MTEDNFEDNMYKEHILELYKNPSNFGELKNPTHSHTETNTLCGDEVSVNLMVEDGKVKDVKFHGSGCVMSMVSASLLTDKIKNMNVDEIKLLDRDDVLDLVGIKVNPVRLKCVLLSLYAIKNSLK